MGSLKLWFLMLSFERRTHCLVLVFFIVFYGQSANGQPSGLQKEGLISPLPIPLVLAGNFGELRSDHFHTGLDFKTEGREGIPVIAASDGVISRVKVSPFGYGRALYLNSPHGVTTVYAHLQKFTQVIEQWVLEEQYRLRQFAVNLYPKRSFTFEQGDTLGWSGNSGGSTGPHLHFEVRETKSEKPLNPLLWNFPIEDHRAPQLDALWFLPINGGLIKGKGSPLRSAHGRDTIYISGSFRLAIEALDRLDGANNECGVFSMEARLNDQHWFSWQLDTLDFSFQKDMNAHAYFPVWDEQGIQVHRVHRLPGNRIPIYKESSLSPELSLSPGVSSDITIRIEDIHGNHTERQWIVSGGEPFFECEPPVYYPYDQSSFILGGESGSVSVPSHAFYEDFFLVLDPSGKSKWFLGPEGQALRKKLTVRVPMPNASSVAESDQGGWVASIRKADGSLETVCPVTVSGEEAVFSTRKLGVYALERDTVPPKIEPNREHLSASGSTLRMGGRSELRFSVSDDLSGLEEIIGFINGRWVRFEWDPKRERIWYDLSDERHPKQTEALVRIIVRDAAGNNAEWEGNVAFP